MRKSVMEKNILRKSKQRFQVDNLGRTDMLIISRAEFTLESGVITLPDETRVPGGRIRSGEFEVEYQFGDPSIADVFYDWYLMGIDDGTERGINPTYKRNATVTFLRSFNGSPGTYNSGSELPAVVWQLQGTWCSQMTIPEYDMSADDGDDAFSKSTATIQYDSAYKVSG